jgi:hypothetical protein
MRQGGPCSQQMRVFMRVFMGFQAVGDLLHAISLVECHVSQDHHKRLSILANATASAQLLWSTHAVTLGQRSRHVNIRRPIEIWGRSQVTIQEVYAFL